jgi:hypothetical protein
LIKKVQEFLKGYGCPSCLKRSSTSFRKWASELDNKNIIFEYYIKELKSSVDGYDPATNTVYQYHGIFWHGCHKHYKQTDIHPILKVPYGQLYKNTIKRNKLIKKLGYKLITKWGP